MEQESLEENIKEHIQQKIPNLEKTNYCVAFCDKIDEKVVSFQTGLVGTKHDKDFYFALNNDQVTYDPSVPSCCTAIFKYLFGSKREVVPAGQSTLQFFILWKNNTDLNIIQYEKNLNKNCIYKYKVHVPIEQLYKEIPKSENKTQKRKKLSHEKCLKHIKIPAVDFSGPITKEFSILDFFVCSAVVVPIVSVVFYKIMNNKSVSEFLNKKLF